MIACRLLAVGTASNLRSFIASEDWPKEFTALELLEALPTRGLWQFEAARIPLVFLGRISLGHPLLTFVLDFDDGGNKGIVRVRNGRIRRHQLRYRK